MRKVITYGGYFESFMETLTEDQQTKVNYGILLLKTQKRVPKKFVEHLEDGLFELRTKYEGNIFRTLFIFDEDDKVVLLNGFQKKSRKTPRKEIEKGKRIMKESYEGTRK